MAGYGEIIFFVCTTFAWFTSSDEVTNRLTATADYGVSIAEKFTPPKDMTPGQKVNKDVSVINTGNVPAFVRLTVENKLQISTFGASEVTITSGTRTDTYTDGTTGTTSGTAEAGKTLATVQVTNKTIGTPTLTNAVVLSKAATTNADGTTTVDEVKAIQSGGTLVFKKDSTVLPKDDNVGDDSAFKPTETGVYIFKRTNYASDTTIKKAASETYTGYYYKAADGTDTGGAGTYYALSEITPAVLTLTPSGGGAATDTSFVDFTSVKVKTKTALAAVDNTKVTYKFQKATTSEGVTTWADESDSNAAGRIVVTYDPGVSEQREDESEASNHTDDDIVFYINLADGWSNSWVYVDDNNSTTNTIIDHFYLKDDLHAGEESAALVDSVELADTVTNKAFADLVYDLNIAIDSVQVTKDEDNKETVTAVGQNWTEVTATPTGSPEITAITWAKKQV